MSHTPQAFLAPFLCPLTFPSPLSLPPFTQATARLKAAQEAEDSPEARATLPRLSLDDIDRQHKEIDVEISQERGTPASPPPPLPHAESKQEHVPCLVCRPHPSLS